MSRDELESEIRVRLNSENEEYTPPEITEDICQACGSVIDVDPYIECYPEHGSDEEAEVTYCDKSCQQDHIQEMMNR